MSAEPTSDLVDGVAVARPVRAVDFLLILRAFACLFVVFAHITAVMPAAAWTSTGRFGPLNLSWLVNSCAQTGVYLFFALSGYLMGKGFAKGRYPANADGMAEFWWNRALRIVPPYAFVIMAAIVVGGSSAPDLGSFLKSTLDFATFRYSGEGGMTFMLGHLWSISTEVQFYITVPLVMMLLVRFIRPSASIAAVTIGIVLALGFAVRQWWWWNSFGDLSSWDAVLYKPLWMNYDVFLSGLLLNYIPKASISRSYAQHVAWYLGGIALIYLVCSYITQLGLAEGQIPWTGVFVVGLPTISTVGSLMMIWYGESIHVQPETLHTGAAPAVARSLAFLGTVTYGLYLWHAPINTRVGMLFTLESVPATYFAHLAIVLPIAILFATISYFGLEHPLSRWRSGHLRLRLRLRQRDGAARAPSAV